jgi:N-terminal acetyltransferase B complex catalytic subunit
MTTIRQFKLNDLLTFNNVNLDILTETYNLSFYLSYMTQWPESFMVAKSPPSHHNHHTNNASSLSTSSSCVMGYVLGKAEGEGKLWHGHVSALTVAPEYRRLGLAATLMHAFEVDVCGPNGVYNAYFVDLFVRASNHLAIAMYEKKFGYTTYRRVLGYYSGEEPEDALDMRKALPRDRLQQSIVPLDHPVRPEDLEW